MNDKQIGAFLSVVQSGSFSAAARKQYISPQAIIQQIDLLEREVGVTLFARSRRGVTLTPAGQLFYNGAVALSDNLKALLQEVRLAGEQSRLRLRIGVFDMSRMMSKACNSFYALHPEITQEYSRISPEAWLDGLEQLKSGELDLFEHTEVPQVHEPGLLFAPLVRMGSCCMLRADHPLAARKSIRPRDLRGMCVGIHDESCIPGLTALLQREAPGCTLVNRHTGIHSAFDLCGGDGIFLLPAEFAEMYRPLNMIPFECDLSWTFGLVFKTRPNHAVQLFVDNARALFPL